MIYNFIAEKTQANLNFNIDLHKDKRVYCFIGENGSGKTQLLETMARSILYSHSLFQKHKEYNAEFYFKNDINDTLKNKKLFLPLEISINKLKIKNKQTDDWGIATFEYINNKKINFSFDKPIVFIGAKNRGYAKNLNKDNVKILGSKTDRFLNSFLKTYKQMHAEEIDEVNVVDWFVSRLIVNPNFVYGQNDATDEVILVCKLLQELEPNKLKNLITNNNSQGYKIDISFREGKLEFSKIPFEKLSTGYISIIKIFQEIIDGFSSWRLDDNDDLSNTEGIVFIDEIEAHLHPKWEQSIIPFLKKHFPKTTFYIATHSPLVISTTEEGESYELVRAGNNIKARELGSPKSWYLADIYSDAFHVNYNEEFDKAQEDIIKLTADYSKLVKEFTRDKDMSKKNEITDLYNRLNNIMADNDPRRNAIDNLKKLVV